MLDTYESLLNQPASIWVILLKIAQSGRNLLVYAQVEVITERRAKFQFVVPNQRWQICKT
jgi:hypothetical protein